MTFITNRAVPHLTFLTLSHNPTTTSTMLRQSLLRLPRAASAHYAAPARCMSSTVEKWIADMKSRPAAVDVDTVHKNRAEKLRETLPLTQDNMSAGSANVALADGFLPKGHNLIYWQPQDYMDNLAADGTSTVSGSGMSFSSFG